MLLIRVFIPLLPNFYLLSSQLSREMALQQSLQKALVIAGKYDAPHTLEVFRELVCWYMQMLPITEAIYCLRSGLCLSLLRQVVTCHR